MDETSENSPGPPPVPQLPPPIPHDKVLSGTGVDSAQSRRKGVLAVTVSVGCGVLLILGLVIGVAATYIFTTENFELEKTEKACAVTIADLGEWFEVEFDEEKESWEAERYFDRSVQIYYFYDDVADEGIQLSCNLTIERKKSDALMMYNMEWSGLNLQNWASGDETIELEMANEMFQWGDASKFAYQLFEGERYGLAFLGRKGTKVFFVDLWGLLLEDPDEISEFLLPHLEQFEKESFKRK